MKWTQQDIANESDHMHADKLMEELQLWRQQVVVIPAVMGQRGRFFWMGVDVKSVRCATRHSRPTEDEGLHARRMAV